MTYTLILIALCSSRIPTTLLFVKCQVLTAVSIKTFFPEGGVGQTQAWMPAFMLAYYDSPDDMSLESNGGMIYWQGKTEELGEKPVPVPFCPPQIPYGLTRARTRASVVRGQRLTTWAMARPKSKPEYEDRLPFGKKRRNLQSRWSRPTFQRRVLPPSSWLIVLIVEAVRASETSVYFNETIRRYIPEGSHLHLTSCSYTHS
jgi:hypothetical protein